jgi:hypothetical protein
MPDDIGSFADEAAKLADAVQTWARGEGPGRSSAAVGHMATGDPACCVCPVCTVIVLLRGERPELTSRLTESLAGLVTAGQGLLETLSAVTAEVRETAAPGNGSPTPNPAPPTRRVQDIPLDDEG